MAVAKMTRVFIAGVDDSREETMRLLQEVGVMHVEPTVEMSGEYEKQSSALLAKVKKLEQMLESLKRYKKRETDVELAIPDEEVVQYTEEHLKDMQEMESRVQTLERLKEDLAPWGDFDLENIRALEEAGVHVCRFRMDEKNWQEFEPRQDVYLEVVSSRKEVLFYTVNIVDTCDIPQAQILTWPELGLEETGEELKRLSERMDKCSDELAAVAARAEAITKEKIATLNEAVYASHMAALHEEPHLFGLQGWIPEDQEDVFEKKLAESDLPLQVVTREPLEDEEPPVLLRNNWFVKRIEPLLKLYGVPKYRDLDPSFYFAPFMVLFFGICMGDVGYGILFYAIAYFMGKKWGDKSEEFAMVVRLCKAFSVASIVVGLLTGSIFGIFFENRSWILIDLDVDVGDPMTLLYISLGIGLVHLSLSYIMGIFESRYFYEKMSMLGTMFVLWGGVTLVARGIWAHDTALFTPLYYAGVGFLIAGVLLTLLFPNDSKKWAARLGLGLWNVYGLVGILGDILSYARLFGLGLATTAIASVMNELAGMAFNGLGPVIGGILGFIIIVVGHGFNFALALLGSTVHSARLHFVEAFKSFFQGDGVEYEPFKTERSS